MTSQTKQTTTKAKIMDFYKKENFDRTVYIINQDDEIKSDTLGDICREYAETMLQERIEDKLSDRNNLSLEEFIEQFHTNNTDFLRHCVVVDEKCKTLCKALGLYEFIYADIDWGDYDVSKLDEKAVANFIQQLNAMA